MHQETETRIILQDDIQPQSYGAMDVRSPGQSAFMRQVKHVSASSIEGITGILSKNSGPEMTSALKSPHPTQNTEVKGRHLSTLNAAMTILNLFVGLGLLSKPYALQQGGLISITALGVVCWVSCYTGKLIVRCFALANCDLSYPDIAEKALGQAGRYAMILMIELELIGCHLVIFIFLWNNSHIFIGSLIGVSADPSPSLLWMNDIGRIAITLFALSLPTTWALNFSNMTWLSYIGFVASACIVLIVAVTFLVHVDIVHYLTYSWLPESGSSFSVAIGIFILSLSGHACLPSIYAEMEHPQEFETMLDYCFVAMFFIYASIGVFGYLTFGNSIDVLVSRNLSQPLPIIGTSPNVSSQIMTFLVILTTFCGVAPSMVIVCEIPEEALGIESATAKRIFRSVCQVATAVMAWYVKDKLALVEALTGSFCTLITSLSAPALLYLIFMKRKERRHKKSLGRVNSKDDAHVGALTRSKTVMLWSFIVIGLVLGIYFTLMEGVAVVNGKNTNEV